MPETVVDYNQVLVELDELDTQVERFSSRSDPGVSPTGDVEGLSTRADRLNPDYASPEPALAECADHEEINVHARRFVEFSIGIAEFRLSRAEARALGERLIAESDLLDDGANEAGR